jgi:imidazole glycerol-phosphate synthase subunit HisH
MKPRVSILDYGMGNIWSIKNALAYLGWNSNVVDTPDLVLSADMIILPGVGSYRKAMSTLSDKRLDEAILELVSIKKRKILGICLGMQLMAMAGEEDGGAIGLQLIPGIAEHFDNSLSSSGLKVPHVGFNEVRGDSVSILFRRNSSPTDFYFTHSYRIPSDIIGGYHGICDYGEIFLASYESDNIFATQFHPEKSQTNGLRLLDNFLRA